ncbi:MAG: polysaccharide biosynthesis/export family protein [Cyclobacteriaceae bacterium]|nr:polysaccharide biosynthesis/export family protein [Cyclobacteriaceae bacterium]
MNLKDTFLFLMLALIGSACVTNKKFVYLQKDDVNIKELPKDSTVRMYSQMQHAYRIQPEDIISVRFESLTPVDFDFLNTNQANQGNQNMALGNALLIGELVDRKGEIPFPFIGKVKVAGLTVFEIQDSLQKIAEKYLESPVVKVRLLNFRFTVLGEVNKEGTIVLNNNQVTLLEAIGWAGGLTDLADKANIKLIRQNGEELTIQYIDLLKEEFISSPYFYIHQNDVLIVSALKQRPYRRYFGQNLALLVSTLSLILLIANLSK